MSLQKCLIPTRVECGNSLLDQSHVIELRTEKTQVSLTKFLSLLGCNIMIFGSAQLKTFLQPFAKSLPQVSSIRQTDLFNAEQYSTKLKRIKMTL